MRFTPERNIKASGQKKVRVRASFGREVKKKVFVSFSSGGLFFYLLFFFRLMYLGSDALTEWSISLKI